MLLFPLQPVNLILVSLLHLIDLKLVLLSHQLLNLASFFISADVTLKLDFLSFQVKVFTVLMYFR
jgi:hypothetical protein